MAEVGCKKAAAAKVESVFSGAGKFTTEAKSLGPKLLERMIKLHYNWKYNFLRPSMEEIVKRYNEKFRPTKAAAASTSTAAPAMAAPAPAPAPAPVWTELLATIYPPLSLSWRCVVLYLDTIIDLHRKHSCSLSFLFCRVPFLALSSVSEWCVVGRSGAWWAGGPPLFPLSLSGGPEAHSQPQSGGPEARLSFLCL